MTTLENVTASQLEAVALALVAGELAVKTSEHYALPKWFEAMERATAIVTDLWDDAVQKELDERSDAAPQRIEF